MEGRPEGERSRKRASDFHPDGELTWMAWVFRATKKSVNKQQVKLIVCVLSMGWH